MASVDAVGAGGSLDLFGNLTVGSDASENGLGGSTIRLVADGLIRLDDTDIRAAQADVTISGLGLTNIIDTTVAGLSIALSGTGSTSDIVVRETDSISSRGITTGGGMVALSWLLFLLGLHYYFRDSEEARPLGAQQGTKQADVEIAREPISNWRRVIAWLAAVPSALIGLGWLSIYGVLPEFPTGPADMAYL